MMRWMITATLAVGVIADTMLPPSVVIPPPPLSEAETEADEPDIEPDINVQHTEDRTVTEYRVNGRLYMLKVQPKSAPPYYLVDETGDGMMVRHDLEPKISIPRWVLFRF